MQRVRPTKDPQLSSRSATRLTLASELNVASTQDTKGVNGQDCVPDMRGVGRKLVLDLGEQPPVTISRSTTTRNRPVYPLQKWLCSSCGLAQLMADPTVPEEPSGTEPAALVAQAADAVERIAESGCSGGTTWWPSTAVRTADPG